MPTMTVEKAYTVLKVATGTPFERVVEAKNNQLQKAANDAEKLMEIETAFDLLFMQHLKKRLTGELEVSTSVRYADVPPPKRSSGASAARMGGGATSPISSPTSTLRASLPSAPRLNISVAAPRNTTLLTTQAVGFSAMAAWSLAQTLLESPEAQLGETAGTQIALTLALGIWSLTQKKMALGKAAGCTMGCLMAGAVLGSLLNAWLRVDIVPLGSFSSPGTLIAECIIAACAAGAIFLI